MKEKTVSPAVTGIIIAIVVVVVVLIGWKAMGPRTDGPSEPIDLSKHMGGNSAGPPKMGGGGGGGPVNMGGKSATQPR